VRSLSKIALALALLLSFIAPARVWAHAELVAADPGAGSAIERLPEQLHLVFSEPLDLDATSVALIDGSGRLIVGALGRIDPQDPRTLLINRSDLPASANDPGSYTLRWKSRSATDGHSSAGEVPYGIIDPATGEVPGLIGAGGHGGHGGLHIGHSSGQILVEVWGRTVGALGLGLALALALVSGPLSGGLRRRTMGGAASPASLVFITGGALFNAGGVDALLALLVVAPTPLLIARIVVELAGATALWLLAARAPSRALQVGALAAAVALLLRSASSHGAAIGLVGALAYLAHLIAVGIWLVALGSIAWVAWRGARRTLAVLLPRVGAIAIIAGGAVAATGLISTLFEIGEPRALLETDYGRVLLIKGLLVIGVMALGVINLYAGQRRTGPLGLRSRSLVELLLFGAVAIAAANLGASSPPGPATPVRLVAAADLLDLSGGLSEEATALRASLSVGLAPGRPGPARLVINGLAATPKWGSPTIELTRLDLPGVRRIVAVREPGADLASADLGVLPANSRWSLTVVPAIRDGLELTRVSYRFTIDERGVSDGRDPLIGAINLLSALFILGLGLAATLLRSSVRSRASQRDARLEPGLLSSGLLLFGALTSVLGVLLLASLLLAA
jgi:methionine-rich copper-binding protein CopC/putative copper export protein